MYSKLLYLLISTHTHTSTQYTRTHNCCQFPHEQKHFIEIYRIAASTDTLTANLKLYISDLYIYTFDSRECRMPEMCFALNVLHPDHQCSWAQSCCCRQSNIFSWFIHFIHWLPCRKHRSYTFSNDDLMLSANCKLSEKVRLFGSCCSEMIQSLQYHCSHGYRHRSLAFSK